MEENNKRIKEMRSIKRLTEAVCASPRSGKLFTTPVMIERVESEPYYLSRKNNPAIRYEVLQEFRRMKRDAATQEERKSIKKNQNIFLVTN